MNKNAVPMTDQERINRRLQELELSIHNKERTVCSVLAEVYLMGMQTKVTPSEDDARAHIISRLDAWFLRASETPERSSEFSIEMVAGHMTWNDDDGTKFFEFRITETQEDGLEGFVPGVPKIENL